MDSEAMITATKNEILQPQDWVFPVPIAYGPGRLTEIGSKAAALGIRNALIVTDRGSRDLPFIAETAAHLATAGVKSGVFLFCLFPGFFLFVFHLFSCFDIFNRKPYNKTCPKSRKTKSIRKHDIAQEHEKHGVWFLIVLLQAHTSTTIWARRWKRG